MSAPSRLYAVDDIPLSPDEIAAAIGAIRRRRCMVQVRTRIEILQRLKSAEVEWTALNELELEDALVELASLRDSGRHL